MSEGNQQQSRSAPVLNQFGANLNEIPDLVNEQRKDAPLGLRICGLTEYQKSK